MTAPEEHYDELMAAPGIGGLAAADALQRIGLLVDLADDLGREEGAVRALEWCDALERQHMEDADSALLEYFRANAWAARQRVRHRDRSAAWAWEQPELRKQVYQLRRAANHAGFAKLSALRQCQVFTNLGNQLNTVGRFVEALEYWGRALDVAPTFAMAHGNRGHGLAYYARALYDGGHRALFIRFAHDQFCAALSSKAIYDRPDAGSITSDFEASRVSLEKMLGPERLVQPLELDRYDVGGSDEEKSYRRWCLAEKLFLNPLNDLGKHNIAARDVLTLPDFVTAVDELPSLIGLFNQMKQEYASARWLYYEGTNSEDVHFSDRGVLLYNTLDYPIYSLAIEKVKAAYRAAYSLFDKIAFFLDSYMKLGMQPQQVSFRRVWHGKQDSAGKRTIRGEFECLENWPLRGLYWLSKDLFEAEYPDVMDPDAQALHEIRNRLEHRYLKVHEMLFEALRDRHQETVPWNDRLAYSIEKRDFEVKTLRLLKLARAALIYVSLGVHAEERRRDKGRGGLVMPMHLDTWDDDWKR